MKTTILICIAIILFIVLQAQTPTGISVTPTGLPPSGAAGGDLSGTFPNPTVAKLNGVSAALYALLASPVFTGISIIPSTTTPNVSLTDNGTIISTNANLADNFIVTALTANVTLNNPTNPTVKNITWEIIQNAGAAKTLTFDTAFGFGTEITGCTISTTLSSHNFITAKYNSTTTKWYVRGCVTGY